VTRGKVHAKIVRSEKKARERTGRRGGKGKKKVRTAMGTVSRGLQNPHSLQPPSGQRDKDQPPKKRSRGGGSVGVRGKGRNGLWKGDVWG